MSHRHGHIGELPHGDRFFADKPDLQALWVRNLRAVNALVARTGGIEAKALPLPEYATAALLPDVAEYHGTLVFDESENAPKFSDGDRWLTLAYAVQNVGVVVTDRPYYATGDGATDDYTAITAAITAAGEGGTVIFPRTASYYLIGEGHSLEPLSGQTWVIYGDIRKYSTATARTDNLIKIEGVEDFTYVGMGGWLGYRTGNHLAIYATGTNEGITFENLKVDRLLSFIEHSTSAIAFVGACRFEDDGTALAAIATGGEVNQTTGVVTLTPGYVDGLIIDRSCRFTGFKDEAVDINGPTINFFIGGVYKHCGTVSGNEVIDIGAAVIASGTIAAAGIDYVVGDTLTISGGYFSTAATFTVTSIDGAGGVTGIELDDCGYYKRFPSSLTGVATTTSGAGTGCTLTLVGNSCGRGVVDVIMYMTPGVEKRALRIKWESYAIDAHLTAYRDSMPGAETEVQSDFCSVEQSDFIKVWGYGENFQQGCVNDGPSRSVDFSGAKLVNMRRNGIACGSPLSSASDNYDFRADDVTIVMENALANDEAMDLNFIANGSANRPNITLGAGVTNVDHIELRAGTSNFSVNDGIFTGGNRGVVVNASCTMISAERPITSGLNGVAVAWGDLGCPAAYGGVQTIATGVITVRTGAKYIIVDTESAGATDDLDTITYDGATGDEIILQASSSSRTVVVKDGTGNMRLAGDCSLDNNEDTIKLVFSTGSVWREIARSDNGA